MLHLISMGLHAVVSANAPLRDHCLQYRHQQAPPQLPGRSRIFSHDFNSDFLDIAAIYFHQNQVEIDPLIPHRAIAAQRVKLLNHGLFLHLLRHFRRLSGINLHNLPPAALDILTTVGAPARLRAPSSQSSPRSDPISIRALSGGASFPCLSQNNSLSDLG